MQIRGWQIDGFGHFTDYGESDLPGGITVFLGPNEAGKSTLLAFLRGMLFGFPTGRSTENRYEPLYTRHKGGKLFIETPQGPYTIQRSSDRKEGFKLYRPDDTLGSESELAGILGHADQGLFKSVFAFSLTELQNLEVHKEEGIKDRIFAGSLQGGRNTAREALRTLEKQNAPIFRPRGREVELVKLAKQLDALRRQIDEARQHAHAYEGLVRQAEQVEAKIAGFTHEETEWRLRAQRHRTLLEIWPKWLDRAALQQELENLDAVDTFPEQAEARLAEMLSALKSLEATRSELRLEQEELIAERNALTLDDAALSLSERISGLAAETPRSLEWGEGLAEAMTKRRHAQAELEGALTSLGPDWSRERLEGFDASIPRMDAVNAWEERLEAAAKQLAEARREAKEASRQADDARSAADELRRRLAQQGEAAPLEALSEAEERLVRIKGNFPLHRELLAERRQLDETLRNLEIEFQRSPSGERPELPRALKAGLWAIALLLLGLALWKGLSQDRILALLLGISAAVLAGVSFLKGKPPASEARAKQFIEEQLRDVQARHDELRIRLDGVMTRLEEDALALGLDEQPSIAEIEALAQRLAQEREHARIRAALEQDLERLEARLAEAEQKRERMRQAEDASREALEAAERSWREWRQAAGIHEERSPRGVAQLFQALASARQLLANVKAHEADEQALARKAEDFRRRAIALLADAGEAAPATDIQVAHAIGTLQERVKAALEAHRRHENLGRELATLESKLEAKQAELSNAKQALAALYAEAGAEDEAEFRRRMGVFAKRNELKRSLQTLERTLDEQFGRDAQGAEWKEQLKSEDVASWKRAIEDAEIALTEIARLRDEANQELGRLQEEQRKLEEAADVIAREHDYQALLDEFQRQARAWVLRGLAEDMIQEALSEAERTRQPAVLSHASGLFSRITEDRYLRLAQHEGGEFQVIDHRENRVPVDKLSRGTAEQLYLCLRLGLIREFAKQATHLPLIMDDVFVNFDPERARRLAESLRDFASDHQVLLFTCHPQTADMLSELDPDIRRVYLPRFGGQTRDMIEQKVAPAHVPAKTGNEDRERILD